MGALSHKRGEDVYRELSRTDHLRVPGIEEAEVPDVLLLVGVFDIHRAGERYAAYLDEAARLRTFPAYLGRLGRPGSPSPPASGGPMAALHVHTWCAAATRGW